MTKYYKQHDSYFPQSDRVHEAMLPQLPPGNFVIKQSIGGLFFERYDKDFEIAGKVYGNAEERARRIMSTFLSREGSTGVLLSGEKGSGKTMLAKLTCKLLAEEHGIPTIFVTQPYTGDNFLELIGNVQQPAVVFFDEFEKVYREGFVKDEDGDPVQTTGSQGSILTLLDGIFTTKKLFILTCNDKYKVDEHMINRPGRIYYAFEFEGLETGFVREYCADNLKDGGHVDGILRVAGMFRHFNFDMLKALVEEVNRYGETPSRALSYLNINPGYDTTYFEATVYPKGLTKPVDCHPSVVRSPFSKEGSKIGLHTYELGKEYVDARRANASAETLKAIGHGGRSRKNDEYIEFQFTTADLRQSNDEMFELMNAEGDRLVLTKKESMYDFRAF